MTAHRRPAIIRVAAPQRASLVLARSLKLAKTSSDEADIWVTGQLGYDVDSDALARQIAELEVRQLNLRINSPGGEVFGAIAIYNALVQQQASVIAHISGWAASSASVVAMAADEIRISEAGHIMVHRPWSIAIGDGDTMRKEGEVLDSIENALIDVYTARTRRRREEISDMVRAETWLQGQAAKDAGFADVVVPLKPGNDEPARPNDSFVVSAFKHMPPQLAQSIKARRTVDFGSHVELEQHLRAGRPLPDRAARKVAAAAWPALAGAEQADIHALSSRVAAAAAELRNERNRK